MNTEIDGYVEPDETPEEPQVNQAMERDEPMGDISQIAQSQGEEPPSEEPASEEKPLSDYTLQQAKMLGLDSEKYDPAEIQSIVDRTEMLALERFQQSTGATQQQTPPQQQQQPPTRDQYGRFLPQQPPQQQPPQQTEQGQEDVIPEFSFGDLKEGWDDEGAKQIFEKIEGQFNQVQKHYKQRLDTMEQMVHGFLQQQDSAAEQKTIEWFDSKLSQLPEDSQFGKGKTLELGPYSPHLEARQKLMDRYIDYCAYRKIEPYQNHDDVLDMFLRVEGVINEPSQKQKQLSDRLRSRSRQTIGRPATRKGGQTADKKEVGPDGFPIHLLNEFQDEIDAMREG